MKINWPVPVFQLLVSACQSSVCILLNIRCLQLHIYMAQLHSFLEESLVPFIHNESFKSVKFHSKKDVEKITAPLNEVIHSNY